MFKRLCCIGWPAVCAALSAAGCSKQPEQLNVDGVKNLRRDGDVFISGKIEPQGLDALARMGTATVIDLRRPSEIDKDYVEDVAARGMKYVNIPMKSNTMTDAQAADCLAALSGAGDAPVALHCASGNRAGAVYGLWISASEGYAVEDAVRRAKQAGMRNAELERDLRTEIEKRRRVD